MKSKQNIITRKIQIIPDYEEKEKFNECYQTLYRWRSIVHKSANLINTHLYIQQQVSELFYFTEETKIKLTNVSKDENGILSTSKTNTTYQVLSKQFKGDCPMSILTTLNMQVTSTFGKLSKEYFQGNRSINNYKKTIPIPFQARSITELVKHDKDYTFSLFGLKFKTNFGRDLSGNQIIFDRSQSGEYKLCDSSILIDGKKIFLLAVFSFDVLKLNLNKDKSIDVHLDINFPMIVILNEKHINIGSKDEYLHRRLAIQAARQRAQMSATYSKGGHGRKKKMKSVDKLEQKESRYIIGRLHQYSKKLIDIAIKNKAGKINLLNLPQVKLATKDDEFLLRNWSYYGLVDKIKYKASMVGIEVESVDQ